jgi:hypothetical protein
LIDQPPVAVELYVSNRSTSVNLFGYRTEWRRLDRQPLSGHE